jgi:hypothetical protein
MRDSFNDTNVMPGLGIRYSRALGDMFSMEIEALALWCLIRHQENGREIDTVYNGPGMDGRVTFRFQPASWKVFIDGGARCVFARMIFGGGSGADAAYADRNYLIPGFFISSGYTF